MFSGVGVVWCLLLPVVTFAGAETPVIRAGVLLTDGSSVAYDYDLVKPALHAAYDESLRRFNVRFEEVLCLYPGSNSDGCSTSNAMGKTYECTYLQNVQLIIGPGCTNDMMASLELQTVLGVPSVTGAGDLVDSTAKFPFITRCSYNTYTQWVFFVNLCLKYKWTNVAVVYNRQNAVKVTNAQSLVTNLRNSSLNPREYPFSGTNVNSAEDAIAILQNATSRARIVVVLTKGAYLRWFMLGAKRAGYLTNGDYAFFTLDPFRDDILGPNGWERGDTMDYEAREAYRSLMVLTLRDTSDVPEYIDFQQKVNETARRDFPGMKFNYYVAAFYDSVLVYALSVNKTLEMGQSIDISVNVQNLSTEQWGKTMPGATGNVYINPMGDRNDDHSMYQFKADGKAYVVASFFGYKVIDNPKYEFDPVSPYFNWHNPTNTPPLNEPVCGYDGQAAACDNSMVTLGIAMGIVGGLLVLAIIIGIFLYRHLSRKAELAQLDLLGTWRDVTKISTPNPKNSNVTKSQAELMGSHIQINQKTIYEDPNAMINQTINAHYNGVRVIVRVGEPGLIEITRPVLAEIKAVRAISHENVLRLQGLCCGPGRVAVMYTYCSKGSLFDLLGSDAVKLDWVFRFSFAKDMMNGLNAITTALGCHGRLKSKCCFIDAHFVLRVADYGLPSFFTRAIPPIPDAAYYISLLWTAPELLDTPFGKGTPEGDVYAFAIILQEVIMREPPFASYGMDPDVVVAKVKKSGYKAFRPKVDANQCPPEITVLMKQCWASNPLERPRLAQIKSIMKESERNLGEHGSILDTLIRRMEQHTMELEHIVEEKAQQFMVEKEKSEQLLYQILPRTVVDQLKRGEHVKPENYDAVTVYYSDIVSFTTLSSRSLPTEVVDLLNDLYTIFDSCIRKFDAYKVETIGDCYVVASGVPIRNGSKHSGEICRLSIMLLDEIRVFKIRHMPNEQLRLRLGAHMGPCVSGVVGLVMPRFCLFGETITIAAKMESSSQPMRIQISAPCERLLQTVGTFETEAREAPIRINDNLEIQTYWLTREIFDEPSIPATEAEDTPVTPLPNGNIVPI
ncbi:atrial natriuretic peptide receptor 1-like isoform X2 [Paramacrobiotus metropolitanus]|uniref:atrial natriuretic peptide receptor 1-like isoform X2 n=1 Tax=Paramacrobiotus metropolitanus TaxID=2943436 RepID=UPI002445F875|nr:atrial natriuretic peptide receptor 1-like isoform X2 [Paramacrobiotus metropolitanus]